MRKLGKRAWLVIGLGLLAVPLVATAIAYGCTAVATLSTNPGAAPAGSTITVSGQGFGTHDPTQSETNGPAEIRLGSMTGPVLATASPTGSKRTFSVQITVPQAATGDTFIVATQRDASGNPVYGTPARQAFTVTAPPAAAGPAGLAVPAVHNQSTTNVVKSNVKAKLAKAIAHCKSKYRASKAKSHKGKKSMARKRAACIKAAKKKH